MVGAKPPGGASVGEALSWAKRRLAGRVPSPEAEGEVLVRHVTGSTRAELYAAGDRAITSVERAALEWLVERRLAQEPLQYLTGTQAFRTLQLEVGPGVLVPRPETEIVVERALGLVAGLERPTVADVGTGSGAIALAIAAERPDASVWGTDISREALVWARRNLERTGAANVRLIEGDLLAPLPAELWGHIDLVVANPPYLSDAEIADASQDVRDHEPRLATVSGRSGLEVPGRVAEEAFAWLASGGWLVMETSPTQAERLRALLAGRYAGVAIHPDLAGLARIAEGRRP